MTNELSPQDHYTYNIGDEIYRAFRWQKKAESVSWISAVNVINVKTFLTQMNHEDTSHFVPAPFLL